MDEAMARILVDNILSTLRMLRIESCHGFAPENWSSRNERISDVSVFVEIGRLWIGSNRTRQEKQTFSYANSMKENL